MNDESKSSVHIAALLALRGCTWRVCGIICFRWLTPWVHRVNGLCRVLSRIILLISITIKSSSLQAVVCLSGVEWWEGVCNMVTALSFTLWSEDERGRRVRGGGRVLSLERNWETTKKARALFRPSEKTQTIKRWVIAFLRQEVWITSAPFFVTRYLPSSGLNLLIFYKSCVFEPFSPLFSFTSRIFSKLLLNILILFVTPDLYCSNEVTYSSTMLFKL